MAFGGHRFKQAEIHPLCLLTEKGVKVATMFVLFHKRLCGPLANSLFVHRPNRHFITNSKLEKAYPKADGYVDKITHLSAA